MSSTLGHAISHMKYSSSPVRLGSRGSKKHGNVQLSPFHHESTPDLLFAGVFVRGADLKTQVSLEGSKAKLTVCKNCHPQAAASFHEAFGFRKTPRVLCSATWPRPVMCARSRACMNQVSLPRHEVATGQRLQDNKSYG